MNSSLIDFERIKKTIEDLSAFNATPGSGITRFSYSVEDLDARKYLHDIMDDLGLLISVDAVGNIRARLNGKWKDAPVIMTGSHIDTVLNGGKYDGVAGVVGGLEILRVILENRIEINHPVELIIFTEEEGSNFGTTMAGSKTLTGKYNIDDLKTLQNFEGTSMYEMAKSAGFDPDSYQDYILKPGEVKAMIEMHIEQSNVLHSNNINIGIIEAAVGSKWFNVQLRGISNHAGATPMHLRNDPMVGAAKIIYEIPNFIRDKIFFTTVGTVGRLICKPNVPNVIPASVSFTVDIRDVNLKGIKAAEEELFAITDFVAKKYGLDKEIDLMGESDPINLSSKVIDVLEEVAVSNKLKYRKMNSGAVHDACILANVTDVGMIFLPSIDGRSHVPEEETSYEDIRIGCALLLDAILKLDAI